MNKLEKDGSGRWIAFNSAGEFVGAIERNISTGIWYLFDRKYNRSRMWSYAEARTELRDHVH